MSDWFKHENYWIDLDELREIYPKLQQFQKAAQGRVKLKVTDGNKPVNISTASTGRKYHLCVKIKSEKDNTWYGLKLSGLLQGKVWGPDVQFASPNPAVYQQMASVQSVNRSLRKVMSVPAVIINGK